MIDMNYTCFGNGEKILVMLPGVSLRRVLLSAAAVEMAYKKMLDKYTIYLFERKNNMPADYTTKDMADDTVAKMEELGIRKAVIYGASQGGMIAQYIAAQHPEMVEALVLASSPSKFTQILPDGIDTWIDLTKKRDLPALVESLAYGINTEQFIKKNLQAMQSFYADTSEEDFERFLIQCNACLTHDTTGILKDITCPAFVLLSKNDHIIDCEEAMKIYKTLNWEYHLYDAPHTHSIYDEAPDFLDRVSAFLDQAIQ